MRTSWHVAWKRRHQVVEQQAKWYDARHKPMSYREGDIMLPNIVNL